MDQYPSTVSQYGDIIPAQNNNKKKSIAKITLKAKANCLWS